jgi:hypothetical protein
MSLTAGEISSLVVAVVALAGALTAYLKSRTTSRRLDDHLTAVGQPGPQTGQDTVKAAARIQAAADDRQQQIAAGADPVTGCMPVTALPKEESR